MMRLEAVGMHNAPTVAAKVNLTRLVAHEAIPVVTIAHRRLVRDPEWEMVETRPDIRP